MENLFKEVKFNDYCNKCKDKDTKEYEHPCNECLENGMNLHTSKPINYTEK